MLKKINTAAEWILKIFDLCACAMLLFAVVAMLLQVVFRIGKMNNQWTQISATYSYVALVFFGGVSATLHVEHIAITTLIDMLPDSIRRFMDVLIHLMEALMGGFLTYSAVNLVKASKILTSSAMTWFKMNYLYVPIGVSCLFITLMAVLRIVNLLADKDLLVRERAARQEEERLAQEKVLNDYENSKGGQ